MAHLKSKKAKTSKKKNTVTSIKFTAEQKKVIKEQITLAVEEAYLQGKEDGARAQQKITIAREKAIEAAAAKFDKEQKKAEKGVSTKPKKVKAAKNAKSAVKATKKTITKKNTKVKATKKVGARKAAKVKPASNKAAVKTKAKAVKAKKTSPVIAGDAPVKKRGRPAKLKIETSENIIETPVSVSE
jgi:hypothetical protein